MLGDKEIGEKNRTTYGDQTEHHIRNQCSESVFVSTKDYPLGSGNEDFEVPEESSRERASLFRNAQTRVACLSIAEWARFPFGRTSTT